MKYYHNLYISDSLSRKKDEIISKLESGKVQLNIYLIVLTQNEKNHLEFFDSAMLQQEIFSKQDLFLVGIAEGYSGALKLIERITRDVYIEKQDVNLRSYIIEKQKEFEESNV